MVGKYPQRSRSHVIGEQAFDIMKKTLGSNFLVSAQTEYDYGTDAKVEIYNESEPTGCVFFVQVKGIENEFKIINEKSDFIDRKYISIQFPVKTLNYANLFSVPFFLFYTSIELNETKFVWLQKYYDIEIKNKNIDINKQETIRIKIPYENDVSTARDEIINIVSSEKEKIKNLYFIMLQNRFLTYYEKRSFDVCISVLQKIRNTGVVIQSNDELIRTRCDIESIMGIDYPVVIEALRKKRLDSLNLEEKRAIDNCVLSLKFHGDGILNSDLYDDLNLRFGRKPY